MKLLVSHSYFTTLLIIILLIMICFFGYQVFVLNRAHSSLQNYAAFRGCVTIVHQTDSSAECILTSGNVIKLVQINNKWYLEGDGPGFW